MHGLCIDQSNEMYVNSSQGVESPVTPDPAVARTLHSEEMIKHDQVFSVEVSIYPGV
jgi:hypothetical protein